MKKILFVLISLISLAYGQDSTKAFFPTDRGGKAYKITAVELNGRVLDTMRYFKIGTDTFRLVQEGIWTMSNGGVYGNGVDMGAKITLAFSRPYVRTLWFTSDSLSVVTLSTTPIIPSGKRVKVDKSVTFIGAGGLNMNGNILEGPLDHAMFASTLTVTNVRTEYGFLPARWFGAIGDGATDNVTFFSRAQSATYRKKQPVFVARGDFRINSLFNQTADFIGDGWGSIIKYNTASVATSVTAWNLNDDSLILRNLTIDGSGKAFQGIFVGSGSTDCEIDHVYVTGCEQVGAETSNTAGIAFGLLTDRLKIHHNTIIGVNAKNNGVSRGIRGYGAGVGPQGVEIYSNFIDSVRSNGSGLLDADDICIQDFTSPDLGMKIYNNWFNNLSKRALKIQANGVEMWGNDIWSNRYLQGLRARAAYYSYGNNNNFHNNTVHNGVYEDVVEIGSGGVLGFSNNICSYNTFLCSVTALGVNDGIRVYGYDHINLRIVDNTVWNTRKGIWLDGTTRYSLVAFNHVFNTTDNPYSTQVTTTSYPNVWHYGLRFIGNEAKKGVSIAYFMYRINGGVFTDNTCDTVTTLAYHAGLDSVIGVSIANNRNNTGGGSLNYGLFANRPVINNPLACENMDYYAIDRDSAYKFCGANGWINYTGGGTGGSGISYAQASQLFSDSIKKYNTYVVNGAPNTRDSLARMKNDSTLLIKSLDIVAGHNMVASTVTRTDSSLRYSITVVPANFSGIPQSAVTNLTTDLTARALATRTITAGVGLSGGGDLSANRTVSMGTPSNITSITTNSVSGTTHTHALDATGVTAGSYTSVNLTVDDKGRITAATNGSSSGASGEYVPTSVTQIPSLTTFTPDTLFWTQRGNYIDVAGQLTVVTSASASTFQTVVLSMPSGWSSIFANGTWSGGGGSAENQTTNGIAALKVINGFGGFDGMLLKFACSINTTYNISFWIRYKYSND